MPNFGGTPAQSAYFSDPDLMAREAASQATTNGGYRTMRDSMNTRAKFDPVDLDATIARARTISADPLKLASGMSAGSTQGRCVPLPPSSGTAARYTATCNTGYTAQTVRRFASGEQDVPVAIAILLALMEWIDLDHTDIADIVEAETKEKAARKSK